MGGEKEGETGSLKGEIRGYMLPVKIAEKILTHFFPQDTNHLYQ